MIKKSEELKVDTVKSLMGGQGELTRIHFMDLGELDGKGRLFCRFSIKPEDSIGYHEHKGEQEAYYILKGKALLNDNGTETVLNPGDFSLCISGQSHSIKNVGEENLEFIALIIFE